MVFLKKWAVFLCGVLVFGVLITAPMHVSALTSAQISAITSLLQSFGADQGIINTVSATLNGQATFNATNSASSILTFAPASGAGSPSPHIADLVADTSQWSTASKKVTHYSVASQWFRFNSEQDVVRLIAGLKKNNLKLEVSAGILQGGACGTGEGFNAGDLASATSIIKKHGGTIDALLIDESMYFGVYGTGPKACHYTPEQVAKLGAGVIAQVKKEFPNIVIGDVQPMPLVDHPDWLSVYTRWAKAFENETGAPLAYMIADVQWGKANWPSEVLTAERQFRAMGIPFGIIYNGDGGAKSSAHWVASAKAHFNTYEGAGGRPDIAYFANWSKYPERVLPETDPSALTHVIGSYLMKSIRAESNGALQMYAGTGSAPIFTKPIITRADAIEQCQAHASATNTVVRCVWDNEEVFNNATFTDAERGAAILAAAKAVEAYKAANGKYPPLDGSPSSLEKLAPLLEPYGRISPDLIAEGDRFVANGNSSYAFLVHVDQGGSSQGWCRSGVNYDPTNPKGWWGSAPSLPNCSFQPADPTAISPIDTARAVHIKALMEALEAYRISHGAYPVGDASNVRHIQQALTPYTIPSEIIDDGVRYAGTYNAYALLVHLQTPIPNPSNPAFNPSSWCVAGSGHGASGWWQPTYPTCTLVPSNPAKRSIQRLTDTQRATAILELGKMVEAYRAEKGVYPPSDGGFESLYKTASLLAPYGSVSPDLIAEGVRFASNGRSAYAFLVHVDQGGSSQGWCRSGVNYDPTNPKGWWGSAPSLPNCSFQPPQGSTTINTNSTPGAMPIVHTLGVGWTGEEVTALQSVLSKLGHFKEDVTGYFGQATQAAVKSFQEANNLSAVGIVGPKTRALLSDLFGWSTNQE